MVGEDEYLPLWKGGKSEKSPMAYEFAQNHTGTPTEAAGNFSVPTGLPNNANDTCLL